MIILPLVRDKSVQVRDKTYLPASPEPADDELAPCADLASRAEVRRCFLAAMRLMAAVRNRGAASWTQTASRRALSRI